MVFRTMVPLISLFPPVVNEGHKGLCLFNFFDGCYLRLRRFNFILILVSLDIFIPDIGHTVRDKFQVLSSLSRVHSLNVFDSSLQIDSILYLIDLTLN